MAARPVAADTPVVVAMPVDATAAQSISIKATLANWLAQLSESPAGKAAFGECAIPTLVTLLGCEQAAADAACALANVMSHPSPAFKDTLREAGGISSLVAFLKTVDPRSPLAPYYASRAVNSSLVAVNSLLAHHRSTDHGITMVYVHLANMEAFTNAGGIPPLVALLSAAGANVETLDLALSALFSLAYENASRCEAIRDAGAISSLVALLATGLKRVDATLACLTCSASVSNCIFDAIIAVAPPLDQIPHLSSKLRPIATERLGRAVDTDALRSAISIAIHLAVDDASLARARARLDALKREAERQARRESLGLGQLPTPNEFICPITCDIMLDPVVASDGHSYERDAIQTVMGSGNGLSPLTREVLTPGLLIPNINLKKRIRGHDEEMLQAAEVAAATARAESGGAAGSSSSSAAAGASASDPVVLEDDGGQVGGAAAQAGGSLVRAGGSRKAGTCRVIATPMYM